RPLFSSLFPYTTLFRSLFLRGRPKLLARGCLISHSVAARDGANRPADVVVNVILQICEGDAHGPVRGGKAAAVEQYDAVVLGKRSEEHTSELQSRVDLV